MENIFIRVATADNTAARLLNLAQVTAVIENSASVDVMMSDGATWELKMTYSEFTALLSTKGLLVE